jgi:hypothetical protein
LEGTEDREQLFFVFEYNTDLFLEETIETFVHYFKEIMRLVLEDTEIKLKDINLSHDLLATESNEPQITFAFAN